MLNNLREIYKFIKNNSKDNNSELADWLLKLIDTADLEQARYNIYSSNDKKIQDMESVIKQNSEKMSDMNNKLTGMTEKFSSLQTEYVAVLGIFASIILAFSGSMSFIGSALQGIEKAPFCKSVFFISLCGFVVLNLIFLVLYIVAKIMERNIYARCMTLDCTCPSRCGSFNRVRKRFPYIFWTNVILLVAMVLSGICCLFLKVREIQLMFLS